LEAAVVLIRCWASSESVYKYCRVSDGREWQTHLGPPERLGIADRLQAAGEVVEERDVLLVRDKVEIELNVAATSAMSISKRTHDADETTSSVSIEQSG